MSGPAAPDPDTPAVRAARQAGLEHEVRVIARARDVEEAAERLDIPTSRLLKTLVVRREKGRYLLVLVPGSRQIDWPKLRRLLGVNRLSMPDAAVAREVTGYERGTITPLGTLTELPVVLDASVAGGGKVSIGGGAHGVTILVDVDELVRVLHPTVADVSS